jgi:hypothetical protein
MSYRFSRRFSFLTIRDRSTNLGLGGLKRSHSAVAIGLEGVEPIAKHIIQVSQAVLDQPVKSLEPVFRGLPL